MAQLQATRRGCFFSCKSILQICFLQLGFLGCSSSSPTSSGLSLSVSPLCRSSSLVRASTVPSFGSLSRRSPLDVGTRSRTVSSYSTALVYAHEDSFFSFVRICLMVGGAIRIWSNWEYNNRCSEYK